MELLVVRHGLAADKAEWAESGRSDSKRPLTAEGRSKTAEAAEGLASLMRVELIATSPWTRAKQTALLLSGELDAPIAVCPALVPSRPFEELAVWLAARKEDKVALVGHEPHLSRFVSWLLTGDARPLLSLKKAQACLLELSEPAPGKASLAWSLPPRALRRLA